MATMLPILSHTSDLNRDARMLHRLNWRYRFPGAPRTRECTGHNGLEKEYLAKVDLVGSSVAGSGILQLGGRQRAYKSDEL